MRSTFFVLVSILLAIGLTAAEVPVESLIPKGGEYVGEIFYLGGDAEHERIAEKEAEAMRKDPEWAFGYSNKYEGKDGLLPYHKKMGVSKEEYQKFFKNKGELKLTKMGVVKVSVKEHKGGRLISIAGSVEVGERKEPFRHGVALAPGYELLKTSYALMENRSRINQKDKNSPTGPWYGVEWKKEEPVTPNFVFIEKYSLGKMSLGDKRVIYYDRKSSEHGTTHFFLKYSSKD